MVFSRVRLIAAAFVMASSLLHSGVLAQEGPPRELKCETTVAQGDADKGLAIVSDARCAQGGDGCIDTICRHCKNATASTEFPTYPSCSEYLMGGSDHASDLTDNDNGNGDDDGSGDGSSDDDGSGDDDSKTLPKNLALNSTVSGTSYGCPYPTSGGDFNDGIQLVGDGACSQGGLGCYQGVCRFCKFRESNNSKHLVTCDSLGVTIRAPVLVPELPPLNPETGCPFNVSSGDLAAGVQLVGDLSCASGGLGCYEHVCRFCKFEDTPQSSQWLDCKAFGYPHATEPMFGTAGFDDDAGGFNGDGDDSGSSAWDGSTGCAYAVSKGDYAVGVQLVRDATCGKGGLGCFADTCRFCQFRPTPQSSHLLPCAPLGWTRPTPSQQPPIGTPQDIGIIVDPVTACPFSVSSGDFAAGVQLVGDLSCRKGGLGCFKDVCRFCKFRETPQSTNWVPCGDYNYPPTAPPISQPADVNEPAVDYSTNCAIPVSEGDYAAGVQLVGDATCGKGGLGCVTDACRFCKFQETPQSKDWVPCDSLGWPRSIMPVERPAGTSSSVDPATECPYAVSSGDFAAGIQLVGDADCVKGGLGCFKNVCRFCQFQETPQSKHWVPCSDLGYPRNGAIFTPASIDVNSETNCPFPVSSGDFDAGIQLVGDGACVHQGGVGCFQDVCRFCKFRGSPQSAAYVNCEDLGYFFGSPSDAIVPVPPSSSNGPSTKCPFPTSLGDLAAGVLLVGDVTCEQGGMGCYQNVCRFCQFVSTEKSNQYVSCASLGYNYALLTPTPTPTPTPLPTPSAPLAPAPAPALPPCPFTVSRGDYAVGLQLIGDMTCAQGGLGCFQDVCRFCKFKETPQASTYRPCTDFLIQPIAAPADIVDTLPPSPTVPTKPPAPIAAQVCDRPVSPGDKNAGVGLVTDYSCLLAGLGCVKGTVCRFCQVAQSEKSNHLEPCAAYMGAKPTIVVAQPPAAVDPATCTAKISVGDTLGGVSAVYDPSCSRVGAGVGCFGGGVCRYCQVFASEKSKDFTPCPSPVAVTLTGQASAVSALRAAAKEQVTGFAASVAQFNDLFKDRTFQWSIVGAACVGVVAVVALVALGAKRAVARRRAHVSADAEADDSDTEETETLKQRVAPETPV